MFDMITWICQHKFGNISTVKMPITMSGKSKIDWNWGEVHIEGVYLYLSKKNSWCMQKLENTSNWQQITKCLI